MGQDKPTSAETLRLEMTITERDLLMKLVTLGGERIRMKGNAWNQLLGEVAADRAIEIVARAKPVAQGEVVPLRLVSES
jgi:hypothetical protein